MSLAREFNVGDSAESPAGSKGKVIAVRDGSVTVRFVDFKRNSWEVIYTPEWFEKWHTYLRKVAG